jgi:hypothetical protein
MLFVLWRLRATERRWQVCLWCLSGWLLSGVVACVHDLVGAHSAEILVAWATSYYAAALTGIAALLIDTAKGVRRDWLHYLGIMALITFAVSNVIHYGLLITKWWTGWISYLVA